MDLVLLWNDIIMYRYLYLAKHSNEISLRSTCFVICGRVLRSSSEAWRVPIVSRTDSIVTRLVWDSRRLFDGLPVVLSAIEWSDVDSLFSRSVMEVSYTRGTTETRPFVETISFRNSVLLCIGVSIIISQQKHQLCAQRRQTLRHHVYSTEADCW